MSSHFSPLKILLFGAVCLIVLSQLLYYYGLNLKGAYDGNKLMRGAQQTNIKKSYPLEHPNVVEEPLQAMKNVVNEATQIASISADNYFQPPPDEQEETSEASLSDKTGNEKNDEKPEGEISPAADSAAVNTIVDGTPQPATQEGSDASPPDVKGADDAEDPDADCPFRNSPIYRKVFVYPNPGDDEWKGDILSEYGHNTTSFQPWPWLEWDRQARANGTSHYDMSCQHAQYSTELFVRELLTNPKSCLRTYDPEQATLFWVPYMSSIERHRGDNDIYDMDPSPYGDAIMKILDEDDFTNWERHWGLTSQYWKRRNGSDHILVYSEALHGLCHPRMKRGNFHFVHSQKMLRPPIAIGVELSTTFVQMYPQCTRKNIKVPYPNPDGRWYNGKLVDEASEMVLKANLNVSISPAVLKAEKTLAAQLDAVARPVAQFYSAGHHGCTQLRVAMHEDYTSCSPSYKVLKTFNGGNGIYKKHGHGMQQATFCPCPGGDSPSAKRMFDALHRGCIPVILSHDFVWPFSNEIDPQLGLDPRDFSVRLVAGKYAMPLLDANTCQPFNKTRPGMEAWMESVSAEELQRLRKGVQKARDLYSWFQHDDSSLPDNPLLHRVLPNGGMAHALVQALADRAEGVRWPACEEELKKPRAEDPMGFKC